MVIALIKFYALVKVIVHRPLKIDLLKSRRFSAVAWPISLTLFKSTIKISH